MSIETSASPIGPSQAATVPELRTFQTLDSSIGRIAENVNLFRGIVAFPLTVLSLRNRGGLEVDVALSYQSDIGWDVSTWNLESPASIVGLGWQMPYSMIQLDFRNAVSPYDDAYYLATTDGGRSLLVLTSQTDDLWSFESENFDFSTILYYPKKQIWRITDSGGQIRTFGADVSAGGSPDALRYAIKWGGADGNWSDSSVQLGQTQFPISWNLSTVQNQWGEKISFAYSQFPDDEIHIGGPGGLTSTRASYLRTITDPSGRIVTFNYGDKIHTEAIREYEAPHVNPSPSGIYAYQDRYETRYLDSIRLDQKVGAVAHPLFTIRLAYSVENLAPASTPGEPRYLYKRYLRGLTTVNAEGKILPGLSFNYYTTADGPEAHTGALKSITYPDGGIATYTYAQQPVTSTALDKPMSSTDPDWIPGIPRFWFAPDYLVLAHYDELDSNKLTVCVHDWNGRWLTAVPIATHLPFSLDLTTLQVLLQEDFFAVSCRVTGAGTNGELLTWAVNRAYGRYGVWNAVQMDMPPILSADAESQVTAGIGFIVAAATGVSQIYRYTYNSRSKNWESSHLEIPTGGAGAWKIGAHDNFFTLCQYQPGMPLSLTLHYYKLATLEWVDSLDPLDNISAYIWQTDLPQLSWTISDTFAVATYLTSANHARNTFNYQARVYLWDKNFRQLPSPAPITGTDIPADTREPVFVSLANGSLIGNVGNLLRFDGINWNQGTLGTFDEGTAVAHFTYGNDIAVGVSTEKGTIGVYDPYLGQFNNSFLTAGSGGPGYPTINAPYVTVRNQIYQQMPPGDLRLLNEELPLDASDVSNQAPTFLAYGQQDGTSFVWEMKNGVLAAYPIQVSGRIFPPQEDAQSPLAGPFAFATYTGISLNQADGITLHRMLFGKHSGAIRSFVVTSIQISDGMGNVSSAVFEYTTPGATGTVSPFGLSTQFSQVKSTLGPGSGGASPFGYSIYSYYDGMTPSAGATGLLYSQLNGMMWKVDGYDSTGKQIAKTTRTWETPQSILDARSGQPLTLIGSYVRMSQSTETIFDINPLSSITQPPLEVPTILKYNDANGRTRKKQTQYYDSTNNRLVEVYEDYVYAYEKYPELADPTINQLVSVVQKTSTSGTSITSIDATTWTNSNRSSVWAPYRRFRARSATATLTPGDWNNTTEPANSQWKKLWQITSRDVSGEVQEYIAGDGLSNSVITDSSGRLIVAAFGNASLAAQQAVYLGFEVYEDLTGWTLAGSLPALQAAIAPGNSYTGSCALVMAGSGTPQSSPLARALTITEKLGRQYVLSCWVRTATGFGPLPGAANWTVSLPGGLEARLDIPDTGGQWQYAHLLFNVPANISPQALALTLTNTKNASLLVDNIRLSPVLSGFTGSVYSPTLLLGTETIQSNGATVWTLRGDFDEFEAEIDSYYAAAKMVDSYISRRGNLGVFSSSDANSRLSLRIRGWGFYQNFNLGNVFDGAWTSATPAKWSTRDSCLIHTAGAEDAIAFTGFPALTTQGLDVFGATVRVRPEGPVTAPLGVGFGSGLRLEWAPAVAAWTLKNSSGNTLVSAPIRSSLNVSFADYSTQLNQSVLPGDFLNVFPTGGLPLAAGSTVVAVTSNSLWRVQDSASEAIYYLVRSTANPTLINVVLFPRQWTLVVTGRTIAFFADGGRVFSYGSTGPVPRGFSLFTSNAVKFDNAVFFTDAEIAISYINADSSVIQEQVATPTDIAPTRMLAKATIYDTVGRAAIRTQAATLTPTATSWGAYDAGVATFDWSTLTIQGLVKLDNPDSGEYPYWRTRYEDSPLGRKVESGLPGNAYAINPANIPARTARYYYGLNDGSWGYAAGKYARNTILNADGGTRVELLDERRLLVASASLKTFPQAAPVWDVTKRSFDIFGLLTNSATPMGWSDTFAYDFLGNAVNATRANEGEVLSMYDSIGRLRFQMDARGAKAPTYIKYWKYDALSRVVEEGCSLQTWPGNLAEHVDDQSFPAATPSNQYSYDFMFPSPSVLDALAAMGKLTRIICGNEVESPSRNAPFLSTERLYYDVYGATTRHILAFAGDPAEYSTAYAYNNQGEIVRIDYPGAESLSVEYRLDLLGRVTAILANNARCAAYEFDQNGNVSKETLFNSTGQQVGSARVFEYAPPGWMSETAGTEFTESTVYAPPNPGAPGYYNGSPTQSITAPRGLRGQITAAYQYDAQGRLSSLALNDGGVQNFSYDSNGNLGQVGRSTNTYTVATRDRVQTTVNLPDTSFYDYDASGETRDRTSNSEPAANLSLQWDCFRDQLLTAILGASPNQSTLNVRYGHRGRRLSKTIAGFNRQTANKLYLRGAGDDALVELTSGSPKYQYIFGPLGLCYFRADASEYFVSKDRMGSIRAIVDAAGLLVAGHDYQPYGLNNGSPFGSNPAILPYRFIGRELDETRCYDLRARAYDPLQGRFISPDPQHQFISPYVYAGNNPLVLTDPNGEWAFIPLLIAFFTAVAETIAEAAAAIAVTTIAGAAFGFVVGVVQGVETIVQNNLSGAAAAGAFFGTVILNTVGGALSGGAGAVTGAFVEGVTFASAAAIAAGVVVQGGISAAQSAAQAALIGDDPGDAAWKNAIAGGTSFLGGSLVSAGVGKALTNAALKGTTKAVIRGVVSGGAGGAIGSGITAGLDEENESLTFRDVLQGVAFGALGGIFPEVVSYKQERRQLLRNVGERRPLLAERVDVNYGSIELQEM